MRPYFFALALRTIFFMALAAVSGLFFLLYLLLRSDEARPAFHAFDQSALPALLLGLALLFFSLFILAAFLAKTLSNPVVHLHEEVDAIARSRTRVPQSSGAALGGSMELDGILSRTEDMAKQHAVKIEALLNANEERAALLSGLKDGVLALTKTGRILSINAAALQLLSIPNFARGALLFDLVRDEKLLSFLREAMLDSEPREARISLLEPLSKHLLLSSSPLAASAHREEILLILINDVTHSTELECMRQEFVANVSHELRTPITSLLGFVGLLKQGAPPEKAERFLEIIERQSTRLLDIVEDLLMLSQMERMEEAQETPVAPVRLHALFEDLAEEFQDNLKTKEMRLHFECPSDLSAQLDRPLLERALINLLTNAMRYSDAGALIELKASLEKKSSHLLFEVLDLGCGIEAVHLPRIFERFYVVDRARSRSAGGTGLGLSIVKHFAAIHDGDVGVESTPQHGSRFWIRIPYLPVESLD
jgi:two-component system, OmpR family, phosphate regulon sensor histidine kinase PhoR